MLNHVVAKIGHKVLNLVILKLEFDKWNISTIWFRFLYSLNKYKEIKIRSNHFRKLKIQNCNWFNWLNQFERYSHRIKKLQVNDVTNL